ncbi:hypothetical protein B484DRAFT_57345 [Ochromonadaceae sp. CCMP2298]|nr:hypothetical protein B484DRAFT_57345 [Ochromonadaceae sp. CCMP2298]
MGTNIGANIGTNIGTYAHRRGMEGVGDWDGDAKNSRRTHCVQHSTHHKDGHVMVHRTLRTHRVQGNYTLEVRSCVYQCVTADLWISQLLSIKWVCTCSDVAVPGAH